MDALTKKFKDYRSPDQSFEDESGEVNVREDRMEKPKEKVLSHMKTNLRGPHQDVDNPSQSELSEQDRDPFPSLDKLLGKQSSGVQTRAGGACNKTQLKVQDHADFIEGSARYASPFTAQKISLAPISAISSIRPTSIHAKANQIMNEHSSADPYKDKSSREEQAQDRKARRRRLNSDEIAVLKREYEQNQQWDTEQIRSLAKRMGISHTKVYKWGFDRRKKEARARPRHGTHDVEHQAQPDREQDESGGTERQQRQVMDESQELQH